YRASRAEVGVQRGALFPTVTANASFRESGGSGRGSGGGTNGGTGGFSGSSSGATSLYQASLAGTWDLDVWGRIRRTIEASVATAQASDADIAAARLSAQSQLAIDYFQLRASDAQVEILMATIEDFQ